MAARNPGGVSATVGGEWPPRRNLLRYMPRLGRLVTAIDLFAAELDALKKRMPAGDGDWQAVACDHLGAAQEAARRGRINDGWEAFHSAQQWALHALSASEVKSEAVALKRQSTAKLVGWMRESAVESIAMVEAELCSAEGAKAHDWRAESGRAPAAAYAELITTRRLLDQSSQDMYVRLRLVGERLLLATVMLAVLLVGLGFAVAADVLDENLAKVSVLHHFGVYLMIGLLGILGALLSFALGSLGSLEHSARRKIYELASGRYPATVARILVGAAAAIVVAIAVQSGIVTLNPDWLPMIAVAAGFSERLVRRIVESLSAGAEEPRPSTRPAGRTARG